LELKRQAEEAEARERAALQQKPLSELQKQLKSKGRDASGKKDDLIEALRQVAAEEKSAAQRTAEVKAMEESELKKLLQSKALGLSNSKDDMVGTVLAYEEKVCRDALAWSAKVGAALAEKKGDLEAKSLAELKEACASRDLAQSGNKEACMERLLEVLKTDGDIDTIVSRGARAARWEELLAMDKEALVKLCSSLGICPFVKEVVVERILSYEEESGGLATEPSAKRARKTTSHF